MTRAGINLWDNSAGNIDANTLEAGEVGGVVPVAGENWNNIDFATGNADHSVGPVTLKNGEGAASGASFQSTLMSGWVSFSGAAGAAVDNGDRDLMSSYISWDSDDDGPMDAGNLMISGLGADFTGPGYDVYIYSDADANNRTYAISASGVAGTVVDSATYDGSFNIGGSGTNENYIVLEGLTADSFSIDMSSTPGRGAVNGIQIVAVPEPAAALSALLGIVTSLALFRRRD